MIELRSPLKFRKGESSKMRNDIRLPKPLTRKLSLWAFARRVARFRTISCVVICAAFFSLAVAGVSWAERLAVAVPIANIRSGPGTSYEVLWKVEKYHLLEIEKKAGKWCRIKDFEGDEGWISRSLLENISAVVLKRDNCNVRSGPGTRFHIVFTAEKGIPFKVLEQKNDWLHVEHADGDQGWLHKSLVW